MTNFNNRIWNRVLLWAGVAGIVLIIFLNNADSVKNLGMTMMIATLMALVLGFPRLRQRMNPILVALTLITAMGGISVFYALSGKFALQSFLYLMTALCAGYLLTLLPERTVATILAAAAALVGLLSLDHLSTRLLSGPVLAFLSRFTTVFDGVAGVEEQVRLTSLFGMPNVFAGCMGLGVLLSLSLAVSAGEKRQRRLALVLLYSNSLGFLLAFSMGATASIAGGFLVYILLERREKRYPLLVLMAMTLVTVILGLIPVSMTVLDGWQGFRPMPLLCVGAGAALLCAGDHYLNERLTACLRRMGKGIFWISGAVIAAGVIFVAAACLLTGGTDLHQGETLRRAVYPEAGSYTLTAAYSGRVSVTVESQNRQEAMMHTSTVLYEGDLSGAAFTVPGDSLVVYLNFKAESESTLERVTLAGDTVPLDYPLLPDYIANRLQGFFANQNAIQRQVFFADGWELFTQSPLLGHGLGAFETAAYRVQGFYYETKYVHNHYIQTLLETGVPGLVLFVGLLIVSMLAILLSRKGGKFHPFLPGLGALVVYMAAHACVEVVFSVGYYLPLAFGVFALVGLCCGDGMTLPKNIRTAAVAAAGALLLSFAVLLGCNLYAAHIGHNAKTLADFQKAAELDPFEWTDYAVSYVAHAPAQGSGEILATAEDYVNLLNKEQSNNIHYHLAKFCFQTGQMERGMEMAHKQAVATASSSRWWNTIFVLLYEYDDGSEAFRAGVQALVELMDQWNRENMGKIVLDEAVQSYVDHVLER